MDYPTIDLDLFPCWNKNSFAKESLSTVNYVDPKHRALLVENEPYHLFALPEKGCRFEYVALFLF